MNLFVCSKDFKETFLRVCYFDDKTDGEVGDQIDVVCTCDAC